MDHMKMAWSRVWSTLKKLFTYYNITDEEHRRRAKTKKIKFPSFLRA